MRKIREVLRLRFQVGCSHRAIQASTGLSKGSVSEYLKRADDRGVGWPEARSKTDAEVETMLFSAVGRNEPPGRTPIDWAWVRIPACNRALCASHDECGQLLSGVPGYCATAANNFGANDTCEPQKDLDAGCREAVECQSNICGSAADPAIPEAGAGQCVSLFSLASLKTCEAYQLHD